MVIINLYEFIFNFMALGIGLLSYAIAGFVFALLINVIIKGVKQTYAKYYQRT